MIINILHNVFLVLLMQVMVGFVFVLIRINDVVFLVLIMTFLILLELIWSKGLDSMKFFLMKLYDSCLNFCNLKCCTRTL